MKIYGKTMFNMGIINNHIKEKSEDMNDYNILVEHIQRELKEYEQPVTEHTALLITLPSTFEWSDYEEELAAVTDESYVMNFKVPFLPKNIEGITRVYLVYRGNIVGWQKFVGCSTDDFTCTTTGKGWKGKFLQRTGPFHKITPIPYKGFQGFRYYKYYD